MSNRILFVDDEPMVLKGLERSLRGMRSEWEMQFVLGGPEALDAMARETFDVVITDMRMPGMDGAELLDQVRQRFSQTVRMVLSGQSDKEAVFRAIRPTHQYLSKPCNIEELKQKLRCALSLRDVLQSPELKQRVSQMENVPSLPCSYRDLRSQLENSHPNLNKITRIVSRDPGMTAKLLQLVSSDFLVSVACSASPKQAVSIIGIENLRSLVLSGSLFSEFPETLAEKLALVCKHSYATALYAEAIARCERANDSVIQECYVAGLLHQIGSIVLASAYPDQFDSSNERSEMKALLIEREKNPFGSAHGLVGAYLLGLWGLPNAIVEAVAAHHAPSQVCPAAFCPLLAVHVADYWERQWHSSVGCNEDIAIDESCLATLGLKERLADWQERCRNIETSSE
jgi:HD-like signal output (HDOD) protein/CheY-like chemotaxis protein